MKNYLSESEQQYYLYVFNLKNIIDLCTPNGIKLYQFADVHYKTSSDSNTEHHQNCDEITFVYSGEGEIITNGKKHSVKSGDVHICFKNDRHQIVPSKTSPLKFYCIGYIPEESNPLIILRNKVQEKIISNDNSVISGRIDLQKAFVSILSTLNDYMAEPYESAVTVNTLNYILSSVLNEFANTPKNSGEQPTMTDNLIYYVTSFLKNNVYKIDALSRLSENTGYSYSYLSHIFSQKMGQSLKDFFTTIRMNTASELLKEKSVTKVAEIMGYSSVQAFTRAYKSAKNISPSKIFKT